MEKLAYYFALLSILFLVGCGGTYHYQLQNIQNITADKTLPGNVSLSISSQDKYNHALGFYHYELYVKDAVEKQFKDSLGRCFSQGLVEKNGSTHVAITTLDASIFPISSVITDVRLFFRVQIFDQSMQLQKTVTIYGFGSNPDGNIALEKATANAFFQLLPILEELFIRQ